VTGYLGSLQKSLEAKRNADSFIDVISAEDISKLPDKNVADALQRLPGIITTSAAGGEGGFGENDRVAIRGTSPSLTQTLINGHAVASGDWFVLDQTGTVGRSVSYSLLPSEIVSQAVVYKSQQADLAEGGVSGSVNIITRKPLDFDKSITASVTAGGAYSDLADKSAPQVNGLLAWKNDAGTIGIQFEGFHEDRYLRRDGQETLGYTTIPTGGANNPFPLAIQGAQVPTYIGNALFTQERVRDGGDLTIEWRPSDKLEILLDGFISHLDASNYNQNDLAHPGQFINQGQAPTAYSLQNGVLTSASFASNPAFDGAAINDIYRPKESSQTAYIDLSASYRPIDRVTLTMDGGYTQGRGNTEHSYSLGVGTPSAVTYAFNGITQPATVSYPGTNINTPSLFQVNGTEGWEGDETIIEKDTEGYGQLDGEYQVDHGILQTIKSGIRIAEHERNVVQGDSWAHSYANAFESQVANGLYPSNYLSGFGNPGGFTINASSSLVQSLLTTLATPGTTLSRMYYPWMFDVKETDVAGYVMAKIGGSDWSGNFGLRVASTHEDVITYDSNPTSASSPKITTSLFGTFYQNETINNYLDLLPSVNLKFDLSKDLLLRVSAAETMARPDYSALGGAVSLTDNLLTGTGGNPNLKPVRAATYDLGAEWYYGKQAAVTAALFYSDFSSIVDLETATGSFLNLTTTGNNLGKPIYSSYTLTIPYNTTGTSKGIELAWTTPLMAGFGFDVNYTYADSAETNGGPMLGAARHTVNGTLYYERDWLSSHLSYTWKSSNYIGLDRSSAEFQGAGGSLDGSLNVNVSELAHVASGFSVAFDALNITDEKLTYYENSVAPRAFYDNGRTFYLTATYRY
jgi:iron complex outermembrane receptor protein